MTTTTLSRERQALQGRVAQILNDTELVLNIGSESGVTPGTRFRVLADEPLSIRDPETGDVLDVIDREKVRVEAREVRPRITICRTYRIRSEPGAGFWFLPALIPVTRAPKDVLETLRLEDKSYPDPLPPEESYVKAGDRAVEVVEQTHLEVNTE